MTIELTPKMQSTSNIEPKLTKRHHQVATITPKSKAPNFVMSSQVVKPLVHSA